MQRGSLAMAAAMMVAFAAWPAAAAMQKTAAKPMQKTIEVNAIDANGIGAAIGTITAQDTRQGLMLTPNLKSLAPPGPHGLHVHDKGNCGAGPGPNGQMAAGMAAGGHLDPKHTGKHMGPTARGGHLGDLPPLVVDDDGSATLPVLAPHLKLRDLAGHALMIHAGGDNFSDEPAPLGGGGGRIACGVLKK
ncbi:MAG TPA: superoxide dismutase [Cu-Zn] SodC [Ferrovibrio sp.]|uniref:superoxide dismutase [Cu-Zn] SodC n=1 Tax=Ferrovibrio sp. TaxID=1917215 RepID=UPI002ED25FBA